MANLAIYEFMQLATTDGTPQNALITACMAGTILTTINVPCLDPKGYRFADVEPQN